MTSALGGNELPSLISAVLGRQWKPSAKGFTSWLDWWSFKIEGQRLSLVLGEIGRSDDVLASRIFRKSKTFVSSKLWPTLDVIVHHQKELVKKGNLLSPVHRKILEIVESEGSTRTDRLRKTVGLEGKENTSKFHRSLVDLENYSLIIGSEDPKPEKHLHANIWQTWEKRTGKISRRGNRSYPQAVEDLLEDAIDTSVLADERQIRKWFSWSNDTEAAVKELLRKNVITRVDSHVLKRETIEVLSNVR